MLKVLKYSFADLARSRWSYVYLVFYLVLGFSLLFLNNDISKGIITLMNVVVTLAPMIATIFGVMYFYNSREFTELLLAQPIRRIDIFLGQFLGISLSLSLSLIIGLGLPFLASGMENQGEVGHFMTLILVGVFLTCCFVAIAMVIGLCNNNRIKGFGYAVIVWLFFAVIYDGLFMILLITFDDYPLDLFTLMATSLNPIDLSRITILLQLDISALLGYTGAIFQRFFGSNVGMIVAGSIMTGWLVLPVSGLLFLSKKKNF